MDSPIVYTNQTGAGLYYVESDNYFPMRGHGWYYEPIIEYCLTNDLIKAANIKYVILSSLTIKGDHYNGLIDYLYSKLDEDLQKISVNGMIGCFKPSAKENWTSLSITRSANEAYNQFLALKGSFIQVHDIEGENFYQVFNTYMTEQDETEAAIYNQILQIEATELHKLGEIIKANSGTILDLNTDCISCVFKNDVLPFDLENDVNLKGFYYDEAKTIAKYKVEQKDERLKTPKLEKYKRSDMYTHAVQKWTLFEDVLDNDFTPIVKNILDDKKSIVINGRAGCGKSTLISKLQADLIQRGIEFITLAPTNKAARIVDGMTMHKFIKLYSSKKAIKEMKFKALICDEMSMTPEVFYKFFITLKRIKPDIQFIVAGDYNQLLPVCDRIENCDYENSAALFELVNGNRLTLTTCRRSDATVYNMCLSENINQVTKDDFTHDKNTTNICFTNKMRKQINHEKMMVAYEANTKGSKQKVLEHKAYKYSDNSQDIFLLKGMPVIARTTTEDFSNNDQFTVKKVYEDLIILTDGHATMEIERADFTRQFNLAYCITTHSSQGATFDYPYTIYELNMMDARLKYVALSRSTKQQYINIS